MFIECDHFKETAFSIFVVGFVDQTSSCYPFAVILVPSAIPSIPASSAIANHTLRACVEIYDNQRVRLLVIRNRSAVPGG